MHQWKCALHAICSSVCVVQSVLKTQEYLRIPSSHAPTFSTNSSWADWCYLSPIVCNSPSNVIVSEETAKNLRPLLPSSSVFPLLPWANHIIASMDQKMLSLYFTQVQKNAVISRLARVESVKIKALV